VTSQGKRMILDSDWLSSYHRLDCFGCFWRRYALYT